ncbi:MAG: TetR family transcriptional regulator [Tardiphaga sp.]|nr:TetR family transcriptional regulator [Tardiphaga sp.]
MKATQSQPFRGRIPNDQLARHEEAFLDAASALFHEHGYARVSIDMIARAAHVSTKTIYGRYGGKLGLFGAVIKKQIAPVLATQDAFSIDQDAEPIALLRKVAAAFLERILDHNVLSLHRMMIAEASNMPELCQLYYQEVIETARGRLAEWLAAQDAAGRLAIPDPKRAADILAALVGAGVTESAQLLNVVPTATERETMLDSALEIFSLAYLPKTPSAANPATARKPRPLR